MGEKRPAIISAAPIPLVSSVCVGDPGFVQCQSAALARFTPQSGACPGAAASDYSSYYISPWPARGFPSRALSAGAEHFYTAISRGESPTPLKIIHYPHPTLRHVSKPLKRVDQQLKLMVREMFDLMYEARGIGLAANQVDLPYRLFVLNLKSDPQQPEEEMVFLNPVITQRKGSAEAEEGCLSLPGLYAEVVRPERVTLNAYDLSGQELNIEADGLFARAIQHEIDHLDGVLFIDRLSPTTKLDVKNTLYEFEDEFDSKRRNGELPDDAAIAQRLAELEAQRA